VPVLKGPRAIFAKSSLSAAAAQSAGRAVPGRDAKTDFRGNGDMTYSYKIIASPVGPLQLVASDKGLAGVLWGEKDQCRVRFGSLVADGDHPVLTETERQLGAYFAGRLRAFTVTLDFKGTAFQKSVWHALLTIPFGETRSYAEIARQIGKPTAVRAVGAANGKNPISIITPCHRVIGSRVGLTGFAGGLSTKQHLLELESGKSRMGTRARP
jgi:methylated-DNA-[protein]-cysteine S-methyltransferase